MASTSRIFPDPEDHYSQQIIESLKFVNWAKDNNKIPGNRSNNKALLELAGDCYALALRSMSDYLLAHEKPDRPRR